MTNIKVTVHTLGVEDSLIKFSKHSYMWEEGKVMFITSAIILYINILVNTYNNYYVKDYYQNLHQSLPEKHTNGNPDVACVSSPLDNQRQSLLPALGYFGDCVT